MREIKFRAWDKKHNKMYKVSEMLWFYSTIGRDHFENNGISSLEGELHEGFTKTMGIPLGFDSIVMQFTGLLDKNGKEIYEGDILKTHEHIDSVVWRDDLSGFSYKNDTSRMNLCDWIENGQYTGTEIIGNIYENPELLNNKL